jgi:hypothetical protein
MWQTEAEAIFRGGSEAASGLLQLLSVSPDLLGSRSAVDRLFSVDAAAWRLGGG